MYASQYTAIKNFEAIYGCPKAGPTGPTGPTGPSYVSGFNIIPSDTGTTGTTVDLTSATVGSVYVARADGALSNLTFNTPSSWGISQSNNYYLFKNVSTNDINVYHTINATGSTLINDGNPVSAGSVAYAAVAGQNPPLLFIGWDGSNLSMI